MNNKNSVAIIGFFDGSAGQVESWFENTTGMKIACFVVDTDNFIEVNIDEENENRVCKTTAFPQNGMLKGLPLICSSNWVNELSDMGIKKVLCLDPINKKRGEHVKLARENGFELVSAIHPTVLVLPDAKIGEGVWINAGSIIGYKAEIGSGTIINTGAQIDHHNIIEECCQIDPGVVTAGNVVMRKYSHLHTGAIVINRIIIGTNSVVGAGSVIIKDIPPDCKVVGVPGRIISSIEKT
jgi:sugar O-acyltransferase (sialic acid O-acetyltransferase NeuD family)